MTATAIKHQYGFGTVLAAPFDEAVARTKASLKEEGFGVLSEIDEQATLKAKLGVAFERYEHDGGSAVSIVDPDAMLGVVENPALRAVAQEAKARLERVVARLASGQES